VAPTPTNTPPTTSFVTATPTYGVLTNAQGNRVNYAPVPSSFSPAGSFGGDIPEGGGTGINKLTINAGPVGYYVYFTINNNNAAGVSGTTTFDTRQGAGAPDLSGNVSLSAVPGQFTTGQNTASLTFNGSVGVPLYVRVWIPPCGTGGSFRIQAHPGGTGNQGNGPGVTTTINCNGYVPDTTPPATCYDYYGQPYTCPAVDLKDVNIF
jgi:hypothetical protein